MVTGKAYDTIQGVWTNPDKLVDWVTAQIDSWTEWSGETDLDVFMNENQLSVFQDGVEHSEKYIPWSDLFPTE